MKKKNFKKLKNCDFLFDNNVVKDLSIFNNNFSNNIIDIILI